MILILWASNGFAQRIVTCKSERELAAKKVQQIINEWPIRKSDSVTDYIRVLGKHIAAKALSNTNQDWHFNVIRDLSPNAFAVGDGYVFITEGAIMMCQEEAELAAILAHEMGHQLAGHFCENSHQHPSDHFLNKYSPFKTTSQNTQRKKSIGSLTQIIDADKESQADKIAVQLLNNAGYDPHAMLQVTKRLPRQYGSFSYAGSQQRLSSLISLLVHEPRLYSRNSEQFIQIKEMLIKQ